MWFDVVCSSLLSPVTTQIQDFDTLYLVCWSSFITLSPTSYPFFSNPVLYLLRCQINFLFDHVTPCFLELNSGCCSSHISCDFTWTTRSSAKLDYPFRTLSTFSHPCFCSWYSVSWKNLSSPRTRTLFLSTVLPTAPRNSIWHVVAT